MSSQAVQTWHLQYIKESVLSPLIKDFDGMKKGKSLCWLCDYAEVIKALSLFKKLFSSACTGYFEWLDRPMKDIP